LDATLSVSGSSEDITGTTPHMKFASSLTHDPKIDNYDSREC
jgi:hypothetical protein